jgi:hypothetical protein
VVSSLKSQVGIGPSTTHKSRPNVVSTIPTHKPVTKFHNRPNMLQTIVNPHHASINPIVLRLINTPHWGLRALCSRRLNGSIELLWELPDPIRSIDGSMYRCNIHPPIHRRAFDGFTVNAPLPSNRPRRAHVAIPPFCACAEGHILANVEVQVVATDTHTALLVFDRRLPLPLLCPPRSSSTTTTTSSSSSSIHEWGLGGFGVQKDPVLCARSWSLLDNCCCLLLLLQKSASDVDVGCVSISTICLLAYERHPPIPAHTGGHGVDRGGGKPRGPVSDPRCV